MYKHLHMLIAAKNTQWLWEQFRLAWTQAAPGNMGGASCNKWLAEAVAAAQPCITLTERRPGPRAHYYKSYRCTVHVAHCLRDTMWEA